MSPAPSLPRLHTLRRADVATLDWLAGTAREAGCDRWSADGALDDAVGASDVLVAGAGECLIECATGAPKADCATVRFIAVSPGRRRLGTGHRSVLALERRLRKQAARCYVVVPSRTGLALYFWLRLGYRPLTQREWPGPPPDAPSVWMVRELD